MNNAGNIDLITLYNANDIADYWHFSQGLPVIEHPKHGKISPNQFRAMYNGKPCPYCGKKMVHGQETHSTESKQEAIGRGYEYWDIHGKKRINRAANRYFHPNYVSLDHKLNKARFPEKMFLIENLQVICWKCNNQKGDNNAYEIEHASKYLNRLVDQALERYPLL